MDTIVGMVLLLHQWLGCFSKGSVDKFNLALGDIALLGTLGWRIGGHPMGTVPLMAMRMAFRFENRRVMIIVIREATRIQFRL